MIPWYLWDDYITWQSDLDGLHLKHLHSNGAIWRLKTHFIHYLDLMSDMDKYIRLSAFVDCIPRKKNTISIISKRLNL